MKTYICSFILVLFKLSFMLVQNLPPGMPGGPGGKPDVKHEAPIDNEIILALIAGALIGIFVLKRVKRNNKN